MKLFKKSKKTTKKNSASSRRSSYSNPVVFESKRMHGGNDRSNRRNGNDGKVKTTGSKIFQMGRTIPGATAKGLNDLDKHALRAATPREKIRHLSYIRSTVVTALVIVAFVVVLLAILIYQLSAVIHVDSDSPDYTSSDSKLYTQTIQNYLNDNPTQRLRFNLDSKQLLEYIQISHPEVYSLSQHSGNKLGETDFTLQMRKPVVSWYVGGNKEYFVDSNGVSFERNYYDSPSVHVVDKSGIHYSSGVPITSERFLSFIGRTVAAAKNQSLEVKEVVIPAGTTHQIKVRLKGQKYPIIMSINRGPSEQVEDMKAAVNYLGKHHRKPKYIDVRVSGKAFYR